MPYKVGEKGSYGCSGYPAVKEGGEVMGCHKTRSEAAAQIYAINISEGNIGKAMPNLKEGDFAMTAHGSDEEVHIGQVIHVMRDGMLGVPGGEYTLEASAENPAVLIQLFEQEENGYWEATNLYTGCMMSLMVAIDPLPQEPEDSEVAMAMDNSMYAAKAINKSMYRVVQDNPSCSEGFAVVDEEGELEGCFATREEATIFAEANNKEEMMDSEVAMAMYDSSIGKSECCPDDISKQAPCWDGYVQRGMKPGDNGRMVPNCVPAEKADDLFEDDDDVEYDTDEVSKAEGYSPPAGARSAARRAIKFKEDGKATGAGTQVGWTRAGQLARGETISLSTVKRMYSYFSRHEVDKKGKDWGNNANPSNGYIMWLAWGGDAGFSWSRGIVNREKDKALFADFGKSVPNPQRLTTIFDI